MQRKIAVICPVANDDICRLIVEVKSVHQVFFGFCGQRGRSIEFAVLQKNRQPMQHRVTGSVQIQNGQTVAFDFIPVSVAIVVDANAPLFGHVGVLSAVKADAIVIVGLTIAELWLFNNMIRTVINCFSTEPPPRSNYTPAGVCAQELYMRITLCATQDVFFSL